MITMRCLIASLFFAISSLLSPAWSTSFTTDQSDLWYIPAESGWGIQFVQRGSVIFATMFVYDQFNTPIWYVATMNPAGSFTWTGDLLLTQGPWFGTVPFNPNAVGFRKVGTMTWRALSTSTGTLIYSVDGVPVSKNVTRQTLVFDDFSGRYGGAVHQQFTGCFNNLSNGTNELVAVLAVAQSGNSIRIGTAAETGITCTFDGTLSQAGQMGNIAGTFSCSSGDFGSFDVFEMQVNLSGLTGRLTASSVPTGCSTNGWFGGMRGTTF